MHQLLHSLVDAAQTRAAESHLTFKLNVPANLPKVNGDLDELALGSDDGVKVWLNDKVDTYVLVPVATGWDTIAPARVKQCVSNFTLLEEVLSRPNCGQVHQTVR